MDAFPKQQTYDEYYNFRRAGSAKSDGIARYMPSGGSTVLPRMSTFARVRPVAEPHEWRYL